MGVVGDRVGRRETTVLVAMLALFPTLVAEGAAACSVCYSSTSETRWAYYGTTALMVLVPLLFVVTIGFWLRRASRAAHGRTPPAESRSGGLQVETSQSGFPTRRAAGPV